MDRISQREYNIRRPSFNFEATPDQNDFFITKDGSNTFYWSIDGKTMRNNLSNYNKALSSIKEYAKIHKINSKIWFVDGGITKFMGSTEDFDASFNS